MDRYATHLEALIRTALRTRGPMLELGCGNYSTPLLCAFAEEQGRELLVQASDREWLEPFYEKYDGDHIEIQLMSWDKWTAPRPRLRNETEWGFVFLDSEESTAGRIERLPALLAVTPIVVMHDADHAMARPRWDEVSQGWQIIEHYFLEPQTVVMRRRA